MINNDRKIRKLRDKRKKDQEKSSQMDRKNEIGCGKKLLITFEKYIQNNNKIT